MDFYPNGQFNNNSQNGNVNNGQNGGFNGASQNPQNFPYGNYSVPLYAVNPQEEQKKKDKNILKTMGFSFGLAIILYFVLSNVVIAFLYLIARFSPSLESFMYSQTGNYVLQSFMSVLFIGGPFLISYSILKKKKYVGILPYGTTYNRKAAVSLTMFLAPVMLVSTIIVNLISAVFQDAVGITFESGMEDMTAEGACASNLQL